MTTDLLERDRDDDLDRRLHAAMTDIATGYRPDAEPVAAPPRRGRWLVGAAAAAVAVLGVAGVWALNRDTNHPVATETTEVVPPAPPWLANLTLPDVPEPEWAIDLDDSLGVGELPLTSPYVDWLSDQGSIASRWFVRSDDGVATAMVAVSDGPARAWDERPTADEYELDGVEAQGGNGGNISWRTADGVRTVASVGLDDDFVHDFALAAVDVIDLDGLTIPDGFLEIEEFPLGPSQRGNSWSSRLLLIPRDERDLTLSALTLDDDSARPIPGGWLSGGSDGDSWSAVVAVDDLAVGIGASSSVDEATMRDIAELITIVPAADVSTEPPSALIDGQRWDGEPLAGGELSWGRWIAIDGSSAATAPGQMCLGFIGLAERLSGCVDSAAGEFTNCARIISDSVYPADPGGRFALVTTEAIEPDLDLTVSVAGEVQHVSIEESGGLTFVLGTAEGAVSNISVTLPDGTELCPA